MTTKPELKLGSHLTSGLGALALFVLMAAVFVQTSFGQPAGFPADASVTASIGYAMFNLGLGGVPAEGFLAAFLVVALVLDVAIDGAIFLAKRESDDDVRGERRIADGGRRPVESDGGDD